MKKYVLVALCLSVLFFIIILQLNIDDDVTELIHQVNDFEWLKHLNYLPNFVNPGKKSELYLPSNINSSIERTFISCFVLSTPKNVLERNAIRQTWGSVIKPLFIIGNSDNDSMRLVMSEAMLFNDIIVEDFVDSYVNLTLKTAFAMKHFLRHFKSSTFFLKIDDDVYLNVENLRQMIDDKSIPKDAIIGRKVSTLTPHREKQSRLYLPTWLYEDEVFPPYLDGPAYLIPGHMVNDIFETAMTVPFFTLEDAFFIGEVAKRTLHYPLFYSKQFRMRKLPYASPCLHNLYIAVHQTLPEETIDLWNHLQSNYSCSLSERINAFYVYKKD